MELLNKVFVYYARLSEAEGEAVYPKERDEEIRAAKNPLQRREKYSAWRLLQLAIGDAFGKDIKAFKFSKSSSGKWVADGFHFSLSHSEGIVAVALSKDPVGVDVQLIKAPRAESFARRVLTDAELEEYNASSVDSRDRYLIAKWSAKEALFKTLSKDLFVPRDYIPTDENSHTEIISSGGADYALSVAGQISEVNIKLIEDLK